MKTRILVVDDSPTIRKVVGSILERHGYDALSAPDGQRALEMLAAVETPVDLVLVDFVMPRMNGFQFCRMLRLNAEHESLPVVLMSAKSDKIRDQFVRQTGALDAITKPFDAQALVAVIEHVMRRVRSGRVVPSVTSVANLPDDLEGIESVKPPSGSGSRDVDVRVARAAAELAKRIADVVAPLMSGMASVAGVGGTARKSAPLSADQLAAALASHATVDTLTEFAASVQGLDFGGKGKLAMSGDIAQIPVGAVLQMLQVEQKTGVLVVSNDTTEITIAMSDGLIDFVQSRNANEEFLIGRFFVEQGLISPLELEELLSQQAELTRLARLAEASAGSSAGSGAKPPSNEPPATVLADRAGTVDRVDGPESAGPPTEVRASEIEVDAAPSGEMPATVVASSDRLPSDPPATDARPSNAPLTEAHGDRVTVEVALDRPTVEVAVAAPVDLPESQPPSSAPTNTRVSQRASRDASAQAYHAGGSNGVAHDVSHEPPPSGVVFGLALVVPLASASPGWPASPAPPPLAPSAALTAAAPLASAPQERVAALSVPPLLGDVLLQTGRIADAQLRGALARQSSELTYEVLRWQRGRFEFRREPMPPLATTAKLQLPVAHIIMEGFRRVDEWRLIESQIESFDGVLQRDDLAIGALDSRDGEGLDRSEQAVLELIDGERTVREIIAASHMSSFDACKVLYQLLEARLVRRKAA